MKKCIGVAFCPPLILLLLSGCLAWSQAEQKHRTIIDMHLHAYRVADFGVGLGRTPAVCSTNEDTVWYGWDPRKPFKVGGAGSCAGTMLTGSNTDEGLMRQTLAMLERYNIRAVTSGDSGDLEQVSKWRAALLTASFRLPVFSSLGVTLKGTRCTVHYQNCADWLPKARSQSSLRLLPNTTE